MTEHWLEYPSNERWCSFIDDNKVKEFKNCKYIFCLFWPQPPGRATVEEKLDEESDGLVCGDKSSTSCTHAPYFKCPSDVGVNNSIDLPKFLALCLFKLSSLEC